MGTAYVALNDDAYNVVRHVTTGNPYKEHMAELMKEGVEIELCGASAKGNRRGNSNLLSGVKVNTNAMVRLTQLERDGYKMIYPQWTPEIRPYVDTENAANGREAFNGPCRTPSHRNSPDRAKQPFWRQSVKSQGLGDVRPRRLDGLVD